jgi:uncharacterized protein (DUF433 family)
MTEPITLVDRGRGLQLSTSRITVQDLVPYFQDNCPDEEIVRWIPSLTPEEVAAVRRYYVENKSTLDEQDCRIRERTAERVRQQENSPALAAIRRRGAEKMAALREEFAKRKQSTERNGDQPAR